VSRTSGHALEVHAGIEAGRLTLEGAAYLTAQAESVTVKVDSLIEPPVWYEIGLATGERRELKRQSVPGYEAGRYRTSRVFAPASDGTLVPVTLAHRADTPLDGMAPCVMWGYGAYESCDDPFFDEALPSLLDRGVVYALTHPRGGGENGRQWWLDGHLAAKSNTFTDHIAVARWLGASLVDPARIATRGLSAGGLLQGVVFSTAPSLWRAVVAEVPFVDVVTTMLDESIPLTANEWDEWGDPRTPEGFAVLRAYSPYDQVPVDQPRPTMLVTGAVHDPRVMVHEPAKWVARLRATATDEDGLLLFRAELGAGAHTGPSGRFAHFRYEADVYAFLLSALLP
jgi:oligopeptidase B